jgi:hypothetical protein
MGFERVWRGVLAGLGESTWLNGQKRARHPNQRNPAPSCGERHHGWR